MNNEEFYLNLVESTQHDQKFEALQRAVNEGDLDAAFEAAHALKGVMANLAITPLQEPISELTELLRAKEAADYPVLVDAIMRKRDEFAAL